jgi:tRNA (guanosine-2'-O-)-methyltransferase
MAVPEDCTTEDLATRMTEERLAKLERVLSQRTRHFAMVLEDLTDPHNISAIIRTSEVYGLQDVHIIEELHPWRINKSVLKGSFKWLDLYRWKRRQTCYENLRARGYQIAVASTNTSTMIHEVNLSRPTAFYMGSEFEGNHPDTLAHADVAFMLPQYGITESMNVSVAAGVLMTYMDGWMRAHGGRDAFALQGEEQSKLRRDWFLRQVFGIDANSPLHESH